jgi:hypothetical protein
MKQYVGMKVLATTSNWFYAPDGRAYRGVFGTLKAIVEAKEAVGFIPNRTHANWFYEIGDVFIMGCQVMYLVRTDTQPPERYKNWDAPQGELKEYEHQSPIYITD